MLRLYGWAFGEKALSYLPAGRAIYKSLGYMVHRRNRGWKSGGEAEPSFKLAQKAREIFPSGGIAMEVGTGWFNHDAFLLYLVGNYTVYLFDIEDNARIAYIRNYVSNLLAKIDIVCKELGLETETTRWKLNRVLGARNKQEIYKMCNFIPCITKEIDQPFLPERSIDYMTGNCVLNHIPVNILIPELLSLRAMLKDDGKMYFLIRHDDHWAFHDPKANQFNYYRYSDRVYRLLFETKLEFQNRLVKPEWQEIFERCSLREEDRVDVITDRSREAIRDLPHLDSRFLKYPRDNLSISYSYVLLRKK